MRDENTGGGIGIDELEGINVLGDAIGIIAVLGRIEVFGSDGAVGAHEGEVTSTSIELKISVEGASDSDAVFARSPDEQKAFGGNIGGGEDPLPQIIRTGGEGPVGEIHSGAGRVVELNPIGAFAVLVHQRAVVVGHELSDSDVLGLKVGGVSEQCGGSSHRSKEERNVELREKGESEANQVFHFIDDYFVKRLLGGFTTKCENYPRLGAEA